MRSTPTTLNTKLSTLSKFVVALAASACCWTGAAHAQAQTQDATPAVLRAQVLAAASDADATGTALALLAQAFESDDQGDRFETAIGGCEIGVDDALSIIDIYERAEALGLAGCLPPIQDSMEQICLNQNPRDRRCVDQACLQAAHDRFCFTNSMAMREYLGCAYGKTLPGQQQIIDSACRNGGAASMPMPPTIGRCECELMRASLAATIQLIQDINSCYLTCANYTGGNLNTD